MDTGEIQLVSTANLGCQRHGIFDGRLFQVIRLFLPVTGNRFSAGGDGNGNAALRAGPREHNGRCRVQRHLLRQDGLIAAGDLNMGVTKGFRSLNPDMLRLQRQGAFQVRVVRRADLLNGIPVLGKFLGLVGFQPCKIGLVVGVGACHQLGILAVGIGQSILPCLGQLIVRPSEHLLAGGNVMVADVDDATVQTMVIAAEEIILGSTGKIGGGILCVLVPGDVPGGGHIDAVEGGVPGNGVGDPGVQIMEIHIGDVFGEEDLVAFVHGNRGIFPPQEALCHGGAVAQLHAGFQISTAGAQDDAHHALHPVNGVVLGQPADDAAVAAFLRFKVAGQEAGRPVVVGPVELHAAGDP